MSDNKKQISKCPPPITPIRGGGYTPKPSNSERLPRWSKWRLMPEVEQWEAVALSLNIEPGNIKTIPHAWMGATHPFDEGDEFNDRLTILNKHCSNRTHFPTPCKLNMANWYKCEVRLDEFASWALSNAEWSIPDELRNMAASVASVPVEHESIAAYQHSEKLPLSVVVAEMVKDSPFVLKALQILSVEDVGSTYSPATAVSGLINHWMVNRDLACYIRNERVDVTALNVQLVEGGLEALENWMTIDKEELAALLEKRSLQPPAFLRQKFEDKVNEPVADKLDSDTINKTRATSFKPVTSPSIEAWKANARKIGEEIHKANLRLNVERIAEKTHTEMTRRHNKGEPGMTGRGGNVPAAATIKRHALSPCPNGYQGVKHSGIAP